MSVCDKVDFESSWEALEGPGEQGPSHDVYRGLCPLTGIELVLPRNPMVEGLALGLASRLAGLGALEAKMLGVLVGRDREGRWGYLKAFSGTLAGAALVAGWAPPLHLPSPTVSEASTLQQLAEWKTRLGELDQKYRAHPFPGLREQWDERQQALRERHRRAKARRDEARTFRPAAELERESRRDSMEWRDFRTAMRAALAGPRAELDSLRQALLAGKRQRAALSRDLQAEMHKQFSDSVSSLLGCPLESLFPGGIPTGTGDCCAPKLLAWAARNEVTPVAMAEVWWAPGERDLSDARTPGQFYPACRERCQPLMGPLLAAALRPPLRILHQDARLVVVEKPSGLLSVPGRTPWTQDSVLTRLRKRWPEIESVHRLDLETSGVMILALDIAAKRNLQRQFEQRAVQKVYIARLSSLPSAERGTVEAELEPDPDRSGCYRLQAGGSLAVTEWWLLDADSCLVELRPRTGRSHQLRVHMKEVLGCPIRGDRLYGQGGERLHLHATRLSLTHPETGQPVEFESRCPFMPQEIRRDAPSDARHVQGPSGLA